MSLSSQQANTRFIENCKNGNLDEINYLMKEYPDINHDSGYRAACRSGQMEIVKILIQCPTQYINLQKKIDEGFKSACEGGQLNLVQFFTLQWEPPANIKSDCYSAITEICHHGHINLFKYLVECPELKQNINPHLNNNGLFKTACQNNKLNIVNYFLYDLNLTITKDITDNLQSIMSKDEYNNIIFQIEKRNLFFQINNSLSLETPDIKSHKSKL